MSIYQGLSKLLVQAFLGTLLSSLAITEAIAQAENPLHISNLAKVENCEFLPSLTSLDAEDVYSVDKYVPKTEQEFREIQLFLEKAYLCRSSLQNMGLINSLDQLVSAKFSQKNLGRTSVSLVMRAFQRLCALNHFRGWNPSKLVDFPRTSHCPDPQVASGLVFDPRHRPVAGLPVETSS
jgi:hypothetical protein